MSTSTRFAVAVHVLTLMAWADEEPLKSEQVAESVNTNPVVIRRMLCELAEANLVVSQTGTLNERLRAALRALWQAFDVLGAPMDSLSGDGARLSHELDVALTSGR